MASVAKKSTVILWLFGTVLFSMQEINSLDGAPTLLTLVDVVGAVVSKRSHSLALAVDTR